MNAHSASPADFLTDRSPHMLVGPQAAPTMRSWSMLGESPRFQDTKIEVASGLDAIRDTLQNDASLRLLVMTAAQLTDRRLAATLAPDADFPSRPWLHVLVLCPDTTLRQLPLLRHFRSWSLLPESSDRATATAMFEDALFRSAESYRQVALSHNLRAEAEVLLARTQSVLGVLRHYGKAPADRDMMATANLMADAAAQPASPANPVELDEALSLRQWAHRMIGLQTARDRLFPNGLVSDPAWDMLLDLTHARLSGKRVSISSLCIASRVPATTALRRIGDLVDAGLAARIRDERDGRRVFVELTDEGLARMHHFHQASEPNQQHNVPTSQKRIA